MSKCGAYVDTTLTWIGNNKLLTLFIVLAFSLMVSTWALADTNSRLRGEIGYMKEHWTPKDETTTATTTVATTTVSSVETTLSTDATTTLPSLPETRRRRRFA